MNALLLDRNYMALSVINWKKAIKLSTIGKAEIIEEHDDKEIHSEKISIKAPSVVRLLNYTPFRASENRVKFNRINVLIRDNFICRYCNIHITRISGTIDHIIPKCLGGLSIYENCVACCKSCNRYKGNLPLIKSGMSLNDYKPRKPTFWELYTRSIKNIPNEWKKYILG